jgi:hypothetical protein
MSSSRKKTRAGAATANPAAVLFYTGGGPIYGDAPARDLTTADLVRLVRIAGLRASGGEPVKPATPEQLERDGRGARGERGVQSSCHQPGERSAG